MSRRVSNYILALLATFAIFSIVILGSELADALGLWPEEASRRAASSATARPAPTPTRTQPPQDDIDCHDRRFKDYLSQSERYLGRMAAATLDANDHLLHLLAYPDALHDQNWREGMARATSSMESNAKRLLELDAPRSVSELEANYQKAARATALIAADLRVVMRNGDLSRLASVESQTQKAQSALGEAAADMHFITLACGI